MWSHDPSGLSVIRLSEPCANEGVPSLAIYKYQHLPPSLRSERAQAWVAVNPAPVISRESGLPSRSSFEEPSRHEYVLPGGFQKHKNLGGV